MFFAGTMNERTPVIPISSLRNQNMNLVCDHIANLPIPIRDYTSEPRLCGKHCFSINDRSAPMKRTLVSYCTHFLKLARGNYMGISTKSYFPVGRYKLGYLNWTKGNNAKIRQGAQMVIY